MLCVSNGEESLEKVSIELLAFMFSLRPKEHKSALQNETGKLNGDVRSSLVSKATRAVQ